MCERSCWWKRLPSGCCFPNAFGGSLLWQMPSRVPTQVEAEGGSAPAIATTTPKGLALWLSPLTKLGEVAPAPAEPADFQKKTNGINFMNSCRYLCCDKLTCEKLTAGTIPRGPTRFSTIRICKVSMDEVQPDARSNTLQTHTWSRSVVKMQCPGTYKYA